jgi:hypothetical protein
MRVARTAGRLIRSQAATTSLKRSIPVGTGSARSGLDGVRQIGPATAQVPGYRGLATPAQGRVDGDANVEGATSPAELPDAGPSMTNLPASTDLLEVYRGMVAQGRLAWDEEQVRIVMKVCRTSHTVGSCGY